ncbi:ABC transporter ATP-binding protein [Paenibacillus albiflavus]|uniref:ABC transporter ATP-binding protein n=1 Tax=Paenibacillus albiflavus TaxID=2545760 RepID=A0A4R4EHU4_9BACL|nr:ABC transporter ATP-binding protein [Paenibacillus albiflavus]TCZ77861.1 ABC transporter ATP-binding protein [Paenibacillus albiflavus]
MLEVSDLNTYHGHLHALKGITFSVRKGELLSIVGSNGAGKSTLLGTLAGVYAPKAGRIIFEGEDITKLSVEQVVARGICLVPERRQIFDSLSVKDNLLLGAYHRMGKDKKRIQHDYDKVLDMFPKLKTMLDRPGGLLSGGEQQMLAIGRGLMSHPKLMMLDEPSLGLAPLIVKSIMEIFAQLKSEFDTTIILVEQNVKAALGVADHACVLERGEIAIQGTAAEMLDHPDVRSAYLGKSKTEVS